MNGNGKHPGQWLAMAAGAIGGLWVSLEAAYQLLLLVMALDVLSGLIAGRQEPGGLKSGRMLTGLRTKFLVLIGVVTAAVVGYYGTATTGAGSLLTLGPVVAVAFAGREVLSILENLERGGADKGVVGWMRARIQDMLRTGLTTK